MKKVIKEVFELEPHEKRIYQVERSYSTIRSYGIKHHDADDMELTYTDGDWNNEFIETLYYNDDGKIILNKTQFFTLEEAKKYESDLKTLDNEKHRKDSEDKDRREYERLQKKYDGIN